MDNEKKCTLAEFSRRALQRMKDKKIPKKQTLHIPSMDIDLTIRSLEYAEIMECLTLEDNGDIKRSDKYSIYLAAVEPNLRDVAREIMGQEAELPPEERELKEPLDIVNMFDLSEIRRFVRIARTALPRLARIWSLWPITTLIKCRLRLPVAQITTARIISRKN